MRKLAIFLVALAACSSARHIREAQDEFSAAAAAENAAGGVTELPPDARAAYRTSLSLIDRELSENEGKLRAEKLMGTALTLKAMCHWRLADLENTDGGGLVSTLNRIKAEGATIMLGARDRVLVRALPGLRDHDRGRRAKEWTQARGFFRSAFNILDASLGRTPGQHPVTLYIRFSQLSVCRAWHDAAFQLNRDDLTVGDTESKVPKRKAKAVLETIRQEAQKNTAARDQALRYVTWLGITDFSWEAGG